MSFGGTVRAHREDLGLRLGEFARRVGITVSYASEIELARKKPPAEAIVDRIVSVLGLKAPEAARIRRQAELERRSFRFELMDRSEDEQEMMAALGRAWDDRTLTDDQIRRISELLEDRKRNKK